MSKQKGLLMTCDRCGKTEFLLYKGTDFQDGGFTSTNDFESPIEKWGFESMESSEKYKDLCPDCYKQFNQLKSQFFKYSRTIVVE